MLNKLVLTAALALSSLPAAAAESTYEYDYAPACTAPEPPAPVSASATRAELDAGRAAANGFIKASDSYQRCLGRALGARQDTAFYAHSNVPKHIVAQIEGRAAANQKQKEVVAASFNAVATARAR